MKPAEPNQKELDKIVEQIYSYRGALVSVVYQKYLPEYVDIRTEGDKGAGWYFHTPDDYLILYLGYPQVFWNGFIGQYQSKLPYSWGSNEQDFWNLPGEITKEENG